MNYKAKSKEAKEHAKKDKGHTETKGLLEKVLKPFQKLMESSAKLTLFELGSKSEEIIAENYFQFIADVKEFALNFQEILGNLNMFAKDRVKFCPNVYSTFKKLYYPNWENNKVEAHFINPLLESFNLIRVNLFKLYSMGNDFWKQPLGDNSVFVENVVDYLDKEIKAEEMVGNMLCRNQTNYLYQICLIIFNSPLKDSFLAREKKIIEKTLPRLVILRSLSHINKVISSKLSAISNTEKLQKSLLEKNEIETNRNKIFKGIGEQLNFALMNAIQPGKDFTLQSLIPEGYVHRENIRRPTGIDLEFVFNENLREDLELFGRMLIWADYLPKEEHLNFVNMARSIKDINQARLNDLEDYMIVDGMMSSAENYLTNRTNAIEKMNALNSLILEETKTGMNFKRPPFLWNDPVTLKENHPIRFSSNSIFEHNDVDLKTLFEFVDLYAEKIKRFNETRWKNMVESVVGVFEKMPAK